MNPITSLPKLPIPFSPLFLTVMICAATGGCQRANSAPRNVEEAAFESTDGGRLKIRDDLVPLLRFTPVTKTAVAAELEGFGKMTFAPGASYAIRLPFDGIVEDVEVEVGAQVEVGQVLCRLRSLDLAKLRSDLSRLTVSLESEQQQLKRLEALLARGSTPERNVLELRARVAGLQAEVEGIRVGLAAARAELTGGDVYLAKAQRAGQVLARNIEPGEQIESTDSEPAFLIGDPTRLIVVAHLPERDAPLLQPGQPCQISVSALGDEKLDGEVSAVVRAIDPSNRTTKIVCSLATADARLQSEMSARVQVKVTGAPRLVVPQSAILLRRESRVVLVRTGQNELERRPVKIGLKVGEHIQVLSGLTEGEQIVIEGAVLLDGELDRVLSAS